jgi:hypothetical protein
MNPLRPMNKHEEHYWNGKYCLLIACFFGLLLFADDGFGVPPLITKDVDCA